MVSDTIPAVFSRRRLPHMRQADLTVWYQILQRRTNGYHAESCDKRLFYGRTGTGRAKATEWKYLLRRYGSAAGGNGRRLSGACLRTADCLRISWRTAQGDGLPAYLQSWKICQPAYLRTGSGCCLPAKSSLADKTLSAGRPVSVQIQSKRRQPWRLGQTERENEALPPARYSTAIVCWNGSDTVFWMWESVVCSVFRLWRAKTIVGWMHSYVEPPC